MRFLIVCAALGFAITSQAALAGVCYEEQFGAHFAEYDYAWQPTGDAARFFEPNYVTAPFEPSETMEHHVCIKGDRLVRAGVILSTIYDLGSGTVTLIRRDKHKYAVISFDRMLNLLAKKPIPTRKAAIVIEDTGRSLRIANQAAAEYDATVFSGAPSPANIVAHASIWKVAKLPLKRPAEYRKRCLEKFGIAYAPVCSLTEPRGFGTLATEAVKMNGYAVMEVLEARVPVPDLFHTGIDSEPGPEFARIFRAEAKISNFQVQTVSESIFTPPARYKRVKRVSAKWLNLSSTAY
ncbi:MAG: hypothetical protein ACRD45_05210 [Bryobacteraceae bacterium]